MILAAHLADDRADCTVNILTPEFVETLRDLIAQQRGDRAENRVRTESHCGGELVKTTYNQARRCREWTA